MTTPTTANPASFALERVLKAAPARVFRAYSDPEELKVWAAPAADWVHKTEKFQFEIGGQEVSSFGPGGGDMYKLVSRFDDIIENQRIVTSFSISNAHGIISSSAMCVEFFPHDDGTILRISEATVFFDDQETPEMRIQGTNNQLDQLVAYLD